MAQAGYTPIQLYYSTTVSQAPSAGNLTSGELAINITDGKLYYKDNLGAVQVIATKAGASGDVVGPASATDNAVVRFDGTTGKLVQNSAVTIADTTGDITGGAYNKVTITAPASSATLTIANGKTLTANASLTLAGTDSTTMTFPSTSAAIARTDAGQTFTGDQTIAGNLTLNAQGDVRFADADSSNWVALQAPTTVGSNVTYTLPATDGSNGQALTTNGTGTLSWATVAGAAGGSNTQIQYNNAGAFAGAAGLTTDGSNLQIGSQGDLRFGDGDNSNWVAFQAPTTVSSNVTWTLPNADGSSGQFLSTDGAGTLSWATASGGGGGGGTSTTTTQVTATGGQTTFNVTYTVGQVSVYLNGALLASSDYTATNGTTVVLASGATAGDIFTAVVYSSVTAISQLNSNVTVSDSGTNGTITFTTDGTEAMRINNSQNVGIGTSSPSYRLHVAATSPRINVEAASTSFAGFRAANSGGNFQIAIDDSTGSSFLGTAYGRVIYSTDAYPIQFATNATERMRITSTGLVGIGTTAPVYQLDVNNASSYSTIGLRQGGTLRAYVEGGNSAAKFGSNGSVPVIFEVNGFERMRITSDQSILVNTTSMTTNSAGNAYPIQGIRYNAPGGYEPYGFYQSGQIAASGSQTVSFGTNRPSAMVVLTVSSDPYAPSGPASATDTATYLYLIIPRRTGAAGGSQTLVSSVTRGSPHATISWTDAGSEVTITNTSGSNPIYYEVQYRM